MESETFGCNTMPELYQLALPGYQGRCTVPVLWDDSTKTIVNNESSEIIVMLNSEFNEFASNPQMDLYPLDLREQIDEWNEKIYQSVNNGVYRCGFAQSQAAYDSACSELFAVLDEIDRSLLRSRYLCGDRVTLADVRLFTTLFRFDAVYYSLFKCNVRRIQDYEHLGAYLRDLYQLPGVAGTCDLEAVKRDYYGNLFPLNPGCIIPAAPDPASLLKAHDRAAKPGFLTKSGVKCQNYLSRGSQKPGLFVKSREDARIATETRFLGLSIIWILFFNFTCWLVYFFVFNIKINSCVNLS